MLIINIIETDTKFAGVITSVFAKTLKYRDTQQDVNCIFMGGANIELPICEYEDSMYDRLATIAFDAKERLFHGDTESILDQIKREVDSI